MCQRRQTLRGAITDSSLRTSSIQAASPLDSQGLSKAMSYCLSPFILVFVFFPHCCSQHCSWRKCTNGDLSEEHLVSCQSNRRAATLHLPHFSQSDYLIVVCECIVENNLHKTDSSLCVFMSAQHTDLTHQHVQCNHTRSHSCLLPLTSQRFGACRHIYQFHTVAGLVGKLCTTDFCRNISK